MEKQPRNGAARLLAGHEDGNGWTLNTSTIAAPAVAAQVSHSMANTMVNLSLIRNEEYLMSGTIDFSTFPGDLRGGFTNVDGMRGEHDHVLLLEKKHTNISNWDRPLSWPQLRALRTSARNANTSAFTYIAEDDTDVRGVMLIGRLDLGGMNEQLIPCTTGEFHRLVLAWDEWAKTHPGADRWQPPVWLADMAARSKAA